MLERARGFIVIEAVDEAQSLIEELLRLRIVRRDRVVEIAQPCDQRDRMSLSMSVSSVILRHRADTQQSTAQHLRQNFHLVNLLNSI